MRIYILISMCLCFCVQETCARGVSLGEHTHAPPRRVHGGMLMHDELCVLVSQTVQACECRLAYLCLWAREHTRAFLPSPASSPTLYSSCHGAFSPHSWEILFMGTKSNMANLIVSPKKASFFSPLLPHFFALFSPPLPISLLPPPPSGRNLI